MFSRSFCYNTANPKITNMNSILIITGPISPLFPNLILIVIDAKIKISDTMTRNKYRKNIVAKKIEVAPR